MPLNKEKRNTLYYFGYLFTMNDRAIQSKVKLTTLVEGNPEAPFQ